MVETRLDDAARATLLHLARAALEDTLVRPGALEDARARYPVSEELTAPRATFVTLRTVARDGTRELRGCIGTMEAIEPLHASVVSNARRAAFHDPRFEPVSREELDRLEIAVSVLTPSVEISDPSEIVPGRDGVRMEKGNHRAVFLPDVASEYGWGREQLIRQLARKAGLPESELDGARWYVFRSEMFGE